MEMTQMLSISPTLMEFLRTLRKVRELASFNQPLTSPSTHQKLRPYNLDLLIKPIKTAN